MNTLDDVEPWVRRRGRETQNPEGVTYVEWLLAAGAIGTSGQRACDVLHQYRSLYDAAGIQANFSRILRKEWRRGVDPTEWRNYFDDEWATLESWRAYKRTSMRAQAAADRLNGEFRTDRPHPGEGVTDTTHVSAWFRVNLKQRRTERWWESRAA